MMLMKCNKILMPNAQNHVILLFAIAENLLNYADAKPNPYAINASESKMLVFANNNYHPLAQFASISYLLVHAIKFKYLFLVARPVYNLKNPVLAMFNHPAKFASN